MDDDGFSYAAIDRPHAFLQWKGTDACFDFHCKCGAFGHFDGYFASEVKCPHCGQIWKMPFNLLPIPIDAESYPGAAKLIEPDEEHCDDDGNARAIP